MTDVPLHSVRFKMNGNSEAHITNINLSISGTIGYSALKNIRIGGSGKSDKFSVISPSISIPLSVTVPIDADHRGMGLNIIGDISDDYSVDKDETFKVSIVSIDTDANLLSSFRLTVMNTRWSLHHHYYQKLP